MSQRIRYIPPADKSTKCACGVVHYWRPGKGNRQLRSMDIPGDLF